MVIPTRRRSPYLSRAIESVLNQSLGRPEIIVVDNSDDGSVAPDITQAYGDVVLTMALYRNAFFAEGTNAGISEANGDFIAVLNDDAHVSRTWAEHVLGGFASPDVGSVASAVLQDRDHTRIDSIGDHLTIGGTAGALGWNESTDMIPERKEEVFGAPASCAVYRRSALEDAGGFDDRFVAYLEDVELGFRLQLRGHRCLLVPQAVAWHVGGATFKDRHYALVLMERNMVWNLMKNCPSPLLRRFWACIVRTQSRPAPVVGGSTQRAWLEGKARAITAWRRIASERRTVQGLARVDLVYLERLMRSRTLTLCHL